MHLIKAAFAVAVLFLGVAVGRDIAVKLQASVAAPTPPTA